MQTDTNASPMIDLSQLPSFDEEVPCEAEYLGALCGDPAAWLLIMGCGHRSGALCRRCRALFITMLTNSAEYGMDCWACTVCGYQMDTPDDVEWRRL